MADNKEGEGNNSHGTEWEVVSLTASAYAAAPGPKQIEVNDDASENKVDADQAETSHAMLMSGHFDFPPRQHENLPIQVENFEIQNVQVAKDDVPQMVADQGGRSEINDEDNWNVKGLVVPDDFPGISFSDEQVNRLSVHSTEFEEEAALQGINLIDKEPSLCSSKFSSFHSGTNLWGSIVYDETAATPEPIDLSDEGLNASIPQLLKHVKDDKNGNPEVPGQAWWKRQAVSLYTQAKEANALWSIFIAAAVMGLVILGQHWQEARWQVLQHRWQFSVNDEKMRRMLSPISRLKDVIVGGNRRGSFIRGSSAER